MLKSFPLARFLLRNVLLANGNMCNIKRNATTTLLTGRIDWYKGVHVDLQSDTTVSEANFREQMKASVSHWKQQNYSAAWLYVDITKGALISMAAEYGFRFHHAEREKAVLNLWLHDVTNRLPHYATHQLGVAGCVVDEINENILLIKEKTRRVKMWKFPGGLADLGEDIERAAEREVYEETGIQTSSRGIIAIREQHLRPEAFGRSDFYIVCLMKPLTHDIHACAVEVDVCKWHKLEDAYKDGESSPLTKRVLDLVRYGLLHGWSSVLMASYDVPTLFGTKANVYHRHLTGIQPSTK